MTKSYSPVKAIGERKSTFSVLHFISRLSILLYLFIISSSSPPLSLQYDGIYHFCTYMRNIGIRTEAKILLATLPALAQISSFGAIFFQPFWIILFIYEVSTEGIWFLEPLLKMRTSEQIIGFYWGARAHIFWRVTALLAVLFHAACVGLLCPSKRKIRVTAEAVAH